MQDIQVKLNKMVGLMGFSNFEVEVDDGTRRVTILINDHIISGDTLPLFVLNVDRIARLMAKKLDQKPVIIDVNHYRRQREELIVKLARAAARRAGTTNTEVALPAMNAYERRLIHTELSIRPDVETKSVGEGYDRHVIVRPI